MMNAKDYRMFEKLKDGTVVIVRAIRPDDKERIVAAFKNLEPKSVYTRFFTHKSQLSKDELKTITEVDFENTVALVVTIGADGGNETIIGAGRYVMIPVTNAPRKAEIAFTVEEDYQRQGISSHILRHLVNIAREMGVTQFEADVLPENRAMLAVFARTGLPLKQYFDGDTMHVTISLPSQTP